ncbi:hypothetical protein HDU67_008397 [Dinochytrium kinnereticum]|nr:hypothetical protein HDU67_008397 [Dinochytrium kinnereticum]
MTAAPQRATCLSIVDPQTLPAPVLVTNLPDCLFFCSRSAQNVYAGISAEATEFSCVCATAELLASFTTLDASCAACPFDAEVLCGVRSSAAFYSIPPANSATTTRLPSDRPPPAINMVENSVAVLAPLPSVASFVSPTPGSSIPLPPISFSEPRFTESKRNNGDATQLSPTMVGVSCVAFGAVAGLAFFVGWSLKKRAGSTVVTKRGEVEYLERKNGETSQAAPASALPTILIMQDGVISPLQSATAASSRGFNSELNYEDPRAAYLQELLPYPKSRGRQYFGDPVYELSQPAVMAPYHPARAYSPSPRHTESSRPRNQPPPRFREKGQVSTNRYLVPEVKKEWVRDGWERFEDSDYLEVEYGDEGMRWERNSPPRLYASSSMRIDDDNLSPRGRRTKDRYRLDEHHRRDGSMCSRRDNNTTREGRGHRKGPSPSRYEPSSETKRTDASCDRGSRENQTQRHLLEPSGAAPTRLTPPLRLDSTPPSSSGRSPRVKVAQPSPSSHRTRPHPFLSTAGRDDPRRGRAVAEVSGENGAGGSRDFKVFLETRPGRAEEPPPGYVEAISGGGLRGGFDRKL